VGGEGTECYDFSGSADYCDFSSDALSALSRVEQTFRAFPFTFGGIMQKDQLGSLDRRLLAYAIAGSTIVGGASIAQAGIISSGELNLSLVSGSGFEAFDLDGDTEEDLVFLLNPSATTIVELGMAVRPLDTAAMPSGTDYSAIVVNGTATSDVVGGVKDAAANLSGGFLIADTLAANSWSTSAYNDTATAKIQTWDVTTRQALEGNFAGATEKYVGFRLHLSSNEDLVYGWAKLSILGDLDDYPANGDIILHEWAYESTPNTPITAGSAAVPEPTSLAIFAMGGVGVAAWKRRRKAA
jgi:hypothetical protein